MTEHFVDSREYGKMLRNAHPLDRWDANSRVVNAVGRLTAQRLNKDGTFAEAIRNNKITSAGNKWHNTANDIAKKLAARIQKLGGAELKSEKTIKAGLGGSRADILFERLGQILAEFDWKTNARSALKSVKQMDRHADQIEAEQGSRPEVQESRSWIDFVREGAPNAAKFLVNLTSLLKTAGKGASPKSEPADPSDLKEGADAHAVAEWSERSAAKAVAAPASGASLATRSGAKMHGAPAAGAETADRAEAGQARLGTRSSAALGEKRAATAQAPEGAATRTAPATTSGARLGACTAVQPGGAAASGRAGLSTRSGLALGDKGASAAKPGAGAGSAKAAASTSPGSSSGAKAAPAPGASPAAAPASPASAAPGPNPFALPNGQPR